MLKVAEMAQFNVNDARRSISRNETAHKARISKNPTPRHPKPCHFCTFSGPAWPMGTPPADSASWGGGMRRGARSCARALGVGSCACNP